LSKVFKAILDKARKKEPKISPTTVYHRIEAYQKKHMILSSSFAQIAYAYEIMNIHVNKLGLDQRQFNQLQQFLNEKKQPLPKTKEERKEVKIPRICKKVIDGFGLPQNLVEEANRMADIYPDLYQLENLVRYVIMSVLEEKYTTEWWENRRVVSKNIADNVEERKHFEKKNRWVAKRGTHNIFYTTFGELARIINLNTKDFKKIFADLEIEAELRKLEPLRNIIAHNNPLPPFEINRIKMALADLEKQLTEYNGQNKKP